MIENANSFPFRPIVFGSVIAVGIVAALTLLVTVLTEFGWLGTIYWSDNLFSIFTYLGVTAGSIMAGLKSRARGWLTGLGAGVFSSALLLCLAVMIGDTVQAGFFLTKALINGFIGVFGGIIGVNLAGNRS
ncbi:MAG: TIGR04086 family membrane protein [Firmicutes bacterium]|nr:TIGR04086 family membrane protein [Bacillota bacterium]